MQNYFTPDIETASRDYLTAIQSARLIKMVENCYKHVPFYKQKFDEIGLLPGDIKSIADITKLPLRLNRTFAIIIRSAFLPFQKKSLYEFMLLREQQANRLLWAILSMIFPFGAKVLHELYLQQVLQKEIIYIYLMATAFLLAASDCIMPLKNSEQPPFPCHPAILTDKCKFCRISVQTLFAVLRRMPCISANH